VKLGINVIKRNGDLVPLDLEKIHNVLKWATNGIPNVSISEIELKSRIQFSEGITTKFIHEVLVKTTADLISLETPNYQYVSARLEIINLRKEAYGQFTPPSLFDHVNKLIKLGRYDSSLLNSYTEDEFNELDQYIDHERDYLFANAGIFQLKHKYLVQDRATKEIFETPQFAFMLIGMYLFANRPKNKRLDLCKRLYDSLSLFKISLPTPIIAGVRTPTRQFASCVLIETDDSIDSINATASSIVIYISNRAGIGVNVGSIRGKDAKIRNGEAVHTGIVPFMRYFYSAVKSCSQGALRGGAATMYYPVFHWEFENLIVLKNNRGIEEARIRHLDYAVQLSKLFYERYIQNGVITLFSYDEVPELYKAFYGDQDKFRELYELYEKRTDIRTKTLSAREVFHNILTERQQTGRIYIQNIDHSNTHSSFIEEVAPIKQSNLCLEITLPTKPLNDVNDPDGEIALCTLAAFNLSNFDINDPDDIENTAEIIVEALDALLDYQEYLVPAAKKNLKRRTLGVGITSLAHYIAKHGKRYSDGSANELVHEMMEAIQYNLLKASNKLAKELGPCEWFNETKYSKGILPIDTYKREVDELVKPVYRYDWEKLREDILQYGLRNSTLTALMPSETSSQVTNSTAGIDPIRNLVLTKSSKDGNFTMIAPDVETCNYETTWQMGSNKGYIDICAILQKFVDQSISTNTNYDPNNYPQQLIPMKVLVEDLFYAYKRGLKTLYYANTRDEDVVEDDGCASGACKI
jgi:ribonucleoside-diphosphate reductase alpha chain